VIRIPLASRDGCDQDSQRQDDDDGWKGRQHRVLGDTHWSHGDTATAVAALKPAALSAPKR